MNLGQIRQLKAGGASADTICRKAMGHGTHPDNIVSALRNLFRMSPNAARAALVRAAGGPERLRAYRDGLQRDVVSDDANA